MGPWRQCHHHRELGRSRGMRSCKDEHAFLVATWTALMARRSAFRGKNFLTILASGTISSRAWAAASHWHGSGLSLLRFGAEDLNLRPTDSKILHWGGRLQIQIVCPGSELHPGQMKHSPIRTGHSPTMTRSKNSKSGKQQTSSDGRGRMDTPSTGVSRETFSRTKSTSRACAAC